MKAPPKLVCLETYWNERLFQSFSVKPFFEAMAPLVHPPLNVAHRFVDSAAGLAYYLRRPGGVMWRQKELFDAPVFYLAFHGRPASVGTVVERIEGDALMEAFAGYGENGYRNLVYFAACNVFRGKQGIAFAKEFVKKTRVQAVLGDRRVGDTRGQVPRHRAGRARGVPDRRDVGGREGRVRGRDRAVP